MKTSSRAASLKPVLSANISNLAMYSSAVMPSVIFRVCSWHEPSSLGRDLRRSFLCLTVIRLELQTWRCMTRSHWSHSWPDLCYPSTHKGKGVQDLHPLICE